MTTLAFAGDTMLGRQVADLLEEQPDAELVAPEVRAMASEADACLVNLECCISNRGERWRDPRKPFFFRAPPHAVRVLEELGTDLVTLANNHALDYGREALADTFEHLHTAGIPRVGAGHDVTEARRPAHLDVSSLRMCVVAATDHPEDFAAQPDLSGVAFADLWKERPTWLEETVTSVREHADLVLVTVHWGPNMVREPVPHVLAAAERLLDAGADLIVGHSAHVFHGVRWKGNAAVLYDLGDFVDDYAVDRRLRNDLGLFWLVHLDGSTVQRVEAVPLKLEHRYTRIADGDDQAWIEQQLTSACERFDSRVELVNDRLMITPER